ncbi:MAG TPA: hypothetical protein V6C76_12440 [Drouetiella sp.]
MDQSSTTARSFEYHVVPVKQNSGENQADAVHRLVKEMAAKSWEIVEACGDEIRKPSLIFVKSENVNADNYMVEIVPHFKGRGEVDDIREQLWKRHDEQWKVLTVLDSPLSPPVGVYKKDTSLSPADSMKVVIIPVSLLENTSEIIKKEIMQQELHYTCRLQTVMHCGLTPVLILLSHSGKPEIEYLVEHAKGGIFSNHAKKLQEVIDSRAKEGWEVCGAFEDESLMPCVVFCRDSATA